MVIHRKLDSVTHPEGIKNWIFSIVRRVASDWRRSHKRKGVSVEFQDGSTAADAQSPQQDVETREILLLVETFLDGLSDKNRSIFVLSEIEQIPVSQISEMLGMNGNTVYSRLRLMRSDLEMFMARHNSGVKAGQQ